ncbi:hypothetical protein B0H14DRAFT_2583123 [Mycena olivaceomarginata]|nr:hypothetical protein B0H14DRAFT_2583123 [Mycena olivaceomarginata]
MSRIHTPKLATLSVRMQGDFGLFNATSCGSLFTGIAISAVHGDIRSFFSVLPNGVVRLATRVYRLVAWMFIQTNKTDPGTLMVLLRSKIQLRDGSGPAPGIEHHPIELPANGPLTASGPSASLSVEPHMEFETGSSILEEILLTTVENVTECKLDQIERTKHPLTNLIVSAHDSQANSHVESTTQCQRRKSKKRFRFRTLEEFWAHVKAASLSTSLDYQGQNHPDLKDDLIRLTLFVFTFRLVPGSDLGPYIWNRGGIYVRTDVHSGYPPSYIKKLQKGWVHLDEAKQLFQRFGSQVRVGLVMYFSAAATSHDTQIIYYATHGDVILGDRNSRANRLGAERLYAIKNYLAQCELHLGFSIDTLLQSTTLIDENGQQRPLQPSLLDIEDDDIWELIWRNTNPKHLPTERQTWPELPRIEVAASPTDPQITRVVGRRSNGAKAIWVLLLTGSDQEHEFIEAETAWLNRGANAEKLGDYVCRYGTGSTENNITAHLQPQQSSGPNDNPVSADPIVPSDLSSPQTGGLRSSLPRHPRKKRQDRIVHARFSDSEDEPEADAARGQTTEPGNQCNKDLPNPIGEVDNGEVPNRKKRKASALPPPDSLGEYEIQAIIASRLKNGICEYLIRWDGYSSADDTWLDENALE